MLLTLLQPADKLLDSSRLIASRLERGNELERLLLRHKTTHCTRNEVVVQWPTLRMDHLPSSSEAAKDENFQEARFFLWSQRQNISLENMSLTPGQYLLLQRLRMNNLVPGLGGKKHHEDNGIVHLYAEGYVRVDESKDEYYCLADWQSPAILEIVEFSKKRIEKLYERLTTEQKISIVRYAFALRYEGLIDEYNDRFRNGMRYIDISQRLAKLPESYEHHMQELQRVKTQTLLYPDEE